MRIMQSILSFLAALYLPWWLSQWVSENIRRSSNSDLLDIWSKWWWLTPWPAPWSIQGPTSIPTPWKIHWSRPSLWSWPKSEFKIVVPGQFCTLVMFRNLKLISHGRSQYWLLGFWVHGLHWEMLSEYLCIGKRTFFGLSMRMPMYMVAPFNNNKHTSRFKIRRQRQFEMLRLSKLVPDYQS